MTIDRAELAPGILVDHGEGQYSLMFSSFPAFDDVFAQRGLPGGGPTFRAMILHLLEEHAPEAIEAIEMFPEPALLTVVSDRLSALREVARMMRKLQDLEVVRDIVEYVDLLQYD